MNTIYSLVYTWFFIFILLANTSYSGAGIDTNPPTGPDYAIQTLQSWQGDFPVSQLQLLPKGQQHLPIGYIDDFKTFSAVWQTFITLSKE